MNTYDQRRKDALVRTLQKAKEQAEIARMYLVTNEREPTDITAACDALEHIEIALERLEG